MSPSLSGVIAKTRTPRGQKAFRYMVVSGVSVVVSQVALFTAFAGFHWTARSSNVLACLVGGVPSYWLNRRWTWGKSGRSHVFKELAPFWMLAFLGLAFSTWAADAAERWALDFSDTRLVQALIVNAAVVGAFGVLWIGKFILFNKVLFVTRDEDLQAALADEIVA